jgi:hypothetical protein
MAEVATIYEINANPGVKTSLAGKVARFCTQDAAEPGLNNPCKLPPTGFYYSFRKTHCLGVTGDFNQARDIYIHGDGNFATDWGLAAVDGGGLFIATQDTGESGLPIDDRKIRIYESQAAAPDGKPTVDAKGNPIEPKYVEIDNPNPAWKRAGFQTIAELTAAAIAVDIAIEPIAVPGVVDSTRPKPSQASTRKSR